ncbi:GWxTD domain-containing protein [Hymenobacter cellulosivorans]|uniref:GWxTD domain-containing protein n=1 Tax=Hymenobacter cellulosivorans TaxID=2932249 RepID=A0ABY4F926_9BACT|nr:GWxTD domain-containing protein [Hymenobacter cellulosivorans]UOQ53167.1 GWxTD domain-containing protein [Hymenobacter cellulosivorans]
MPTFLRCLPLGLLLLLSWAAHPLVAQRRDFTGQYQPLRRIQVDTRREGDSLRVYLYFPDGSVLQRGEPLRVAVWENYQAKRPLWRTTVGQLARRIHKAESAAWVEFCVAAAAVQPGQVLSASCAPENEADTGDAAWLSISRERLARPFLLTDSLGDPLLRRYVRRGERFLIDCYGPDKPTTAKHYDASFVAALPPMSTAGAPPQQRKLPARDSLFFRAGQLLTLSQPGLYALRVSGTAAPVGLLVTDEDFPELNTADELIQPLIYLTTSAERNALREAAQPKRAVDQFWLKVAGGNQTQARQLIRTYYGRVAAANQLFTAHKAGWMTDRGMLYTVLGAPETVYRTATEENWVYRGTREGSTTYTFRHKPSTFAPEHYELVRRPEYEMLWYAAVEQWRKGMTTARSGR